jgi:hypothetical protein
MKSKDNFLYSITGITFYKATISRNLLSALCSDATNKTNKKYLRFKLVSVGVENFLPIVSQCLYLFILTMRKKPFFARKHPSKKKTRFGEVVGDTAKYATYVNEYDTKKLLPKLYFKLMRRQLSPEEPSIKLYIKYTKIIVWNASLTKETNGIETNQNAYLPEMPMCFKFFSHKALTREIAFWVRFFDFLKPTNRHLWYLQLSHYHFFE